MRDQGRNLVCLDEWRRLMLKHLKGCLIESEFSCKHNGTVCILRRCLSVQHWQMLTKRAWRSCLLSCIYHGHEKHSTQAKTNLESGLVKFFFHSLVHHLLLIGHCRSKRKQSPKFFIPSSPLPPKSIKKLLLHFTKPCGYLFIYKQFP